MMNDYISRVTNIIEFNEEYDSHLGFTPGDYYIKYERIIDEDSHLNCNKNQLIHVKLIKNTTLSDLMKVIPKNSIVKSIKRMR